MAPGSAVVAWVSTAPPKLSPVMRWSKPGRALLSTSVEFSIRKAAASTFSSAPPIPRPGPALLALDPPPAAALPTKVELRTVSDPLPALWIAPPTPAPPFGPRLPP